MARTDLGLVYLGVALLISAGLVFERVRWRIVGLISAAGLFAFIGVMFAFGNPAGLGWAGNFGYMVLQLRLATFGLVRGRVLHRYRAYLGLLAALALGVWQARVRSRADGCGSLLLRQVRRRRVISERRRNYRRLERDYQALALWALTCAGKLARRAPMRTWRPCRRAASTATRRHDLPVTDRDEVRMRKPVERMEVEDLRTLAFDLGRRTWEERPRGDGEGDPGLCAEATVVAPTLEMAGRQQTRHQGVSMDWFGNGQTVLAVTTLVKILVALVKLAVDAPRWTAPLLAALAGASAGPAVSRGSGHGLAPRWQPAVLQGVLAAGWRWASSRSRRG